MIERERTYLIKNLPEDLHKHPVQEILDVYVMGQDGMAQIRARKKGKTYELTKKVPLDQNNTAIQKEETFEINEDEFDYLYTYLPFKIKKKRYAYKKGNMVYEIDIFDGEMKGLIMVDVEFNDEKTMKNFAPEAFLGKEITNNNMFAGGILCQKKFQEISEFLQ